MFKKKFGITKLIAEKLFSEVHNHFIKFGTVTDHRSKKMSPVKRNLKEAVKSRIDSNSGSSIRKIAYSVRRYDYEKRYTP